MRVFVLAACAAASFVLSSCALQPVATEARSEAPVTLPAPPGLQRVESDRVQARGVAATVRNVEPRFEWPQGRMSLQGPDPTHPYRKGPPAYPKGVGWPAPEDSGAYGDPIPQAAVKRADASGNAVQSSASLVFDSLTFDDNAALGGSLFIPPDTHGAAGPDHVVNVVNASIRMHNKTTGAAVFSSTLRNFFTAPGFTAPVNATFDPKVLYDHFEDRWLVITLEKTASDSALFLAVSETSDPTGAWILARIPAVQNFGGNDCWFDYPGFAVGTGAVYITGNYFRLSNNASCGPRLVIVGKAFYDGDPLTATFLDPVPPGGFALTNQPAHMLGEVPEGLGTYLTGFSGLANASEGFVQAIRVSDSLVAPVLSVQFVGMGSLLTNVTATAPQSGTANGIAVNDRRTLDAVWRNDRLYTVFSARPPLGDPAAALNATWWMEIDTSIPAALQRVDLGRVDGRDITNNGHTFFGAIAVNSRNELGIGFSVTGPDIFPSSGYAWRRSSDPPGSVRDTQILRAGLASYFRTFGGTANRWGDYSSAVSDPFDDCFWFSNQHATTPGTVTGGDGRWVTATARLCPNQVPQVLGTIADRVDMVGDTASFSVTGNFFDPDGDELIFSTSSALPNGISLVDGVFEGELQADANGDYLIVVEAIDVEGESASASFSWLVLPDNTPPSLDAPLSDREDAEGDKIDFTVVGNFSDPDDDELTFTSKSKLPDGIVFDNGAFSGTLGFDSEGEYVVAVTAEDGFGGSVAGEFTWTVANTNRAPDAEPDSYSTDRNTVLEVEAPGVLENDSDADGDALEAEVFELPMNGSLELEADGGFTYTPKPGFCGSDAFSYRATDGDLFSSEAVVDIEVVCTNQAPVADSLDPDSTPEFEPYERDVSGAFSDPDGDEIIFSAEGLPGSLDIDPETGVISGTTVFPERGEYEVTVRGTDPDGLFAEATFLLTVEPPLPLPDELFDDGFEPTP